MLDALTGLYNRHFLNSWLEREVDRAYRYEHDFALAILDLDFFKRVNDSLGYDVGDLVLREIAGILRCNSRHVDIIARYGGEEFALLMPETSF